MGLDNEKTGKPLLRPFMKKGVLVRSLPTLNEIAGYVQKQVASLPANLVSIKKQKKYSVTVSKSLNRLLADVLRNH
ncbi:MAG: hypothetical protein AAB733_02150 [Patescibacteria group bacterium]